MQVQGRFDLATDAAGRPLGAADFQAPGFSWPAFAAAYDPATWGRRPPAGPLSGEGLPTPTPASVPAAAVLTEAGASRVFVVDNTGRVQERVVTLAEGAPEALVQRFTDRVGVMERGVLVESGTHAELLVRGRQLLARVGIERLDQPVETMSRGQMQRVAVARALVARPPILVADEPTASLDAEAGLTVAELLTQLAREERATLIVASHDVRLIERQERVLRLEAGQLVAH